MPDREKVIKGLTECVTAGFETACPLDCPYFPQCFPDVGPASPFMQLMQDALTLLKEQGSEYENGFNDAMQGKQELMYEGVDGKWYKKAW